MVLTRSRENLDNINVLSSKDYSGESNKWYIVQTNMDVYKEETKDPRYIKAVESLENIKDRVERIDSTFLVENVLHQEGVQTSVTIFAAGITPKIEQIQVFKRKFD